MRPWAGIRGRAGLSALAVISVAATQARSAETSEEAIALSIDATHASRRLVSSTITVPVAPGKNYFWHPNWLPGIAGPTRQVSNLVGLVFRNESGDVLSWRRDPHNANRFCATVPEGVRRVTIDLKYVLNQPTRLSSAVDSYGDDGLLVLNFNSCLLYPESDDASALRYSVRVQIADGLHHACAIRAKRESGGVLDFGEVSLGRLIDSPLVAGEAFHEWRFSYSDAPKVRLCLFADSSKALDLSPERAEQLERLMPEAVRLFGGAPFSDYTFLVVCTDRLPRFGLEHKDSCLITLRPNALVDDKLFKYRAAYLLAHELTHAWCGKHRVPGGMLSNNFHTPFDTELLWVYEGLTQYLMQLVAVRSGQVDFDYHLGYLADRFAEQSQRRGRAWRSLADTAVSAHTLRGLSSDWRELRRSQDYYDEGALFWLRVDCLIRSSSQPRFSLDDFCQRFFRANGDGAPKAFDLDEVCETLDEFAPGPWRSRIQRLIYRPRQSLELEGLSLAGYQLGVRDRPSAHRDIRDEVRGLASAESSIGLVADHRGYIKRVRAGSPAYEAGLPARGKIVAVNRRDFSRSRLHSAIRKTASGQTIELIVKQDDRFDVTDLSYDGGARFPTLTKRADQPDRLRAILTRSPAEGRGVPVAGDSQSGVR